MRKARPGVLTGNIYDLYTERSTKRKKQKKSAPRGAVYLFASFDLCDFTALKVKYPHRWFDVLVNILQVITEKSFGMNFWKFIGDEFLFYKEISTALEVVETIEDAHDFMRYMEFSTRAALKDGSFVSVATGMWIANITNTAPLSGDDVEQNASNFLLRDFRLSKGGLDFVGVNVDEGFRMCQMASRGCIVVDPKIVYMFLSLSTLINKRNRRCKFTRKISTARLNALKKRVKAFAKSLVFIEYGSLKGVPGGDDYPIMRYVKEKRRCADNTHTTDNMDILEKFFIKAQSHESMYTIMRLISVYKHAGAQLIRPLKDRPKGSWPE